MKKYNPFFDFLQFSLDVYEVPEDTELLSNFYFRLDVNQIEHSRQVFSLMDFIGDIGGVPDLLLQVGGWVIGSYAAFYASLSTFSELYRVR